MQVLWWWGDWSEGDPISLDLLVPKPLLQNQKNMKAKFHLAMLGSAVLVLSSNLSVFAIEGEPIVKIPIGLEGDPGSVIVARTQTDAKGKFEFRGLKAGKYRLVLQSVTETTADGRVVMDLPGGKAPETATTTVRDGTSLQLERTFTITVTPVNDVPTISLPINRETGRSSQAIVIPMDGGTISGALKIAENESPRPQDRARIYVGDDRPHRLSDKLPTGAENVTVVVGKFISYTNGKLVLLVSAKEGEEPQLAEFGRIGAVVVDPTDPMARKTLPAEEAFKNLPVGTPVKLQTNAQGSIIAILVGLLLPKTADAPPQGAAEVSGDPNAWRYKQQNGEWWYYGVDEKWLVHRGGKWIPYTATGGPDRLGGAGGNQGGNGNASIFDRWGNLRAPVEPGTRAGAAIPGAGSPDLGSPVGGILPGLRKTGTVNTTPGKTGTGGNTGGAFRSPFGGKK